MLKGSDMGESVGQSDWEEEVLDFLVGVRVDFLTGEAKPLLK